MTMRLADLAPTDDELTTLREVVQELTGQAPADWQTASFSGMGLDAFDRLELATVAEDRFGVYLDDQIAGEHTAADLLAAVRAALRPGQLPHA